VYSKKQLNAVIRRVEREGAKGFMAPPPMKWTERLYFGALVALALGLTGRLLYDLVFQ